MARKNQRTRSCLRPCTTSSPCTESSPRKSRTARRRCCRHRHRCTCRRWGRTSFQQGTRCWRNTSLWGDGVTSRGLGRGAGARGNVPQPAVSVHESQEYSALQSALHVSQFQLPLLAEHTPSLAPDEVPATQEPSHHPVPTHTCALGAMPSPRPGWRPAQAYRSCRQRCRCCIRRRQSTQRCLSMIPSTSPHRLPCTLHCSSRHSFHQGIPHCTTLSRPPRATT